MDAVTTEADLDPDEIIELARRYGQPEVWKITLEADEYLFQTRRRRADRRRGEVVMAIEQNSGAVLLHRKGWYERGVFRLPTGGIDSGDLVENTLFRELKEETGLHGGDTRFLGIVTCLLQYQSDELPFTSYVFHVYHPQGELRIPKSKEDISDIREVPIKEFPEIAKSLRDIPPPRARWGHWRAIAHDMAHETLIPAPGR